MVNVGDKLFHWRYGELKVTKIENSDNDTYVYTKPTDINGIVEDPFDTNWNKYLKEETKVFKASAIGYWVHDNMDDAVIGNRNSSDNKISQGQAPLAMSFPIKGDVFHKIYEPIVSEYKEIQRLKKAYKEKENELKKAEKTISKLLDQNDKSEIEANKADYKNDYEFNNAIKDAEAKCDILKSLLNYADWNASIEVALSNNKLSFNNDNAFNEFKNRMELFVEDIKKLLPNDLITLKNQLKNQLEKINADIKAFEQKNPKYKKLDDENYVIFEPAN